MPSASQASFRERLDEYLEREILRFTAVGNVDDGKSTLLGRLLHDTGSIYDDQLAGIRASGVNRAGAGRLDLSLLTDGLRAEREQGITIDVAYRYFSTPRRKFILADTPGHAEFTRNMATGASTADVAIILIDAHAFQDAGGLQAQTRRHTFILRLLRVPQIVVAVNKMDLVGCSEELFQRIIAEFRVLAAQLDLPQVECIPLSALLGDNVVEPSAAMPWHTGPTLLRYLETVPLKVVAAETEPMRFPVQLVMPRENESPVYAGRIARGVVSVGLQVKALPSGESTRVRKITTSNGELSFAAAGENVTLELEGELDLSRGNLLIAETGAPPVVSKLFRAKVVWMHETKLTTGVAYLAKHTTHTVRVTVRKIRFLVDVSTYERHAADELAMNEIAEVDFEADDALFFDSYAESREMGALILIDPVSNATVGAVMLMAAV